MRYLVAALVLVAAEALAVAYWWTSEAWDCGVQCSTSQETARWLVLVPPVLLVALIVVALVRRVASLIRER